MSLAAIHASFLASIPTPRDLFQGISRAVYIFTVEAFAIVRYVLPTSHRDEDFEIHLDSIEMIVRPHERFYKVPGMHLSDIYAPEARRVFSQFIKML